MNTLREYDAQITDEEVDGLLESEFASWFYHYISTTFLLSENGD